MRTPTWMLCTALCACGAVQGQGDDDLADDAAPPADRSADAAPADAGPPTGRDCQAIHVAHPDAPTGQYTIDPDGDGGRPPYEVPCDMTSRGGGWTIVFLATSSNHETALDYTTATPALLDVASQVMVAFRRADLTPHEHDAVFAMPPPWRQASPLTAPAQDVTLPISIDGAAAVPTTLRYGTANFAATCEDDWVTATPYGRFCFTRTAAPFYTGFTVNTQDFCTDSQSAYNTVPCDDDRRFSIAVR